MKKDKLFTKAVALRQQGYSYKEVHTELKISRSTAFTWLNKIELDQKAMARILERGVVGRSRSRQSILRRIKNRDEWIRKDAQETTSQIKLNKNLCRLLCSFLYWGEGAKTGHSVGFTNSDPEVIRTFLKLFRVSFPMHESKLSGTLHLHPYHDEAKQKEFWSQVTGISSNRIFIYRKLNSGNNIRANYPGCIQIRYNDTVFAQQIMQTYKVFAEKLLGDMGA